MAVRLKDIANDLGVSVVTVSKVLRGNADIGEETRNLRGEAFFVVVEIGEAVFAWRFGAAFSYTIS